MPNTLPTPDSPRRGYVSNSAGLKAACTAYAAPGFEFPDPTRMDIAVQAYLAATLPETFKWLTYIEDAIKSAGYNCNCATSPDNTSIDKDWLDHHLRQLKKSLLT